MSTSCASEAFFKELKNLRIEDFPCGFGSWRQTSDKNISRFDSGGVQYENIEALIHLEASSPYKVDCSWSKEAASLRKIAIETPEFLKDPNFVFKHFTTLRIVDKNVNDIDEGILKFVNLKELILTANYINKIDGKKLPRGLEVLELTANNVSDLSALKSSNLCSLLHLGLSKNQINHVLPHSFTPSKWPSLLSLDLSYNNLTDLQNTVEILKHLPTLRNLLLIGNPLHLSKCYHGFVIDNIPSLSYLDNQEISADDKHNFKSFSKIKDLDINGSYITVRIIGISDVKKPVQVEDPDAGEYPKIEFKYHVEFIFMKDVALSELNEITANVDKEQFEKTAATVSEDDSDTSTVSTDKLHWAETLEFDFCKTFRTTHLNYLRSFLKDGVTFSVVGVKHSYVAEDPKLSEEQNKECEISQTAGTSDKQSVKTSASKDPGKLDNKERKKSAKVKSVTRMPIGKEKGGKKDKRDVSELFELPQEPKTVGTCHVALASFFDGEMLLNVSSPCVEESGENENELMGNNLSRRTSVKPQSGKRQDDKKKGKGDGEKHQKLMPSSKGKAKSERGKSANPGTGKGNKGGKGKEKMEDLNESHGEEEAPLPPPPLSIKLEIKLERLTGTKDALND